MQITINGKQTDVKEAVTITQLLSDLKVDRQQVAVEQNLTIIPRSQFDTTLIKAGDTIELVEFVGGG